MTMRRFPLSEGIEMSVKARIDRLHKRLNPVGVDMVISLEDLIDWKDGGPVPRPKPVYRKVTAIKLTALVGEGEYDELSDET
jgi:hypothetical protein